MAIIRVKYDILKHDAIIKSVDSLTMGIERTLHRHVMTTRCKKSFFITYNSKRSDYYRYCVVCERKRTTAKGHGRKHTVRIDGCHIFKWTVIIIRWWWSLSTNTHTHRPHFSLPMMLPWIINFKGQHICCSTHIYERHIFKINILEMMYSKYIHTLGPDKCKCTR